MNSTPFLLNPVILDGAMGTGLQALDLPSSSSAFDGHEGCPEILNLTRPSAVRSIHDGFLSVGCDGVETNTFGANTIVLGEFGLSDKVYELNRWRAELARHLAAFVRDHGVAIVGGCCGTTPDHLAAALMNMHDPETDRPILKKVYCREELWQGSYLDRAPDLVADPHEGFDLKGNLGKHMRSRSNRMFRPPKVAGWSLTAKEYLNGMHTFDDAFGYIRGHDLPADNQGWIGDLHPTVLKLMGVEVPEGLHSRPLF